MGYPNHPGRMERPTAKPQLPAFCRTRRLVTTTVRVNTLRQLQWLLWLVLALQLSTVLLVLAGQVPAPPAATPGSFTPAGIALRQGAPVPSQFKP
jgi:hypothetical protein